MTDKQKIKEEAIDKAIQYIKKCPYKGTGIKIELEAQLGRESMNRYCRMCLGQMQFSCPTCQGDNTDCPTCDGTGISACTACNGTGREESGTSMSISDCSRFLLSHVTPEARSALVFHKTYNDGSVDTEFTFTLPIEKVRYAMEFIKAFKELGEHIGRGTQISGAGMHICILNSPDCKYPAGNRLETRRAQNFKYSMTKLLPALFFLASSNYHSRRLNYRLPSIELDVKYGAVSGQKGCFEYRVFETCYQRPEAILDNLCVIANTLRFYHYRRIELPFFGKIGNFGFQDIGQGVERFFATETNYAALLAGVKFLKPSYKSLAELKKERNFKLTLQKIKSRDKVLEAKWLKEFPTEFKKLNKEYSLRFADYKNRYERIKTGNPGDPCYVYPYTNAQFIEKYPTLELFMKASRFNLKPISNQTEYLQKKKSDHENYLVTNTITI